MRACQHTRTRKANLQLRAIPAASSEKSFQIRGINRGIHSDWIYKQLESSVDGIIDVRLKETSGEPRSLIRIRNMQNVGFDTRRHQLSIGKNLEIGLEK